MSSKKDKICLLWYYRLCGRKKFLSLARYKGGLCLSVKKSFSFFLVVVVFSVVGLLITSMDMSTFNALKKADLSLVFLALLITMLGWALDAVKFICLARAAGERIRFRDTMAVVWINYFGCAITPMQSGGGPFQIYLLYKNGVSVGKAVAITLVRTLQVLFLLAALLPFSVIIESEFAASHPALKWFVGYAVVFIAVGGVILVVSLIRPHWIKRFCNALIVKLKNIGVIRPSLLFYAVRWVNREIDSYSTNMRLFLSSGKWWFILSLVTSVAHLIAYMSIMPCLISAFGYSVNYLHCLLAESLLLFLLYFAPTPGGSGAAEAGAAGVLGLFVPWNVAGILAILWRIISEYTGITLGAVIALRAMGWHGMDDVMQREGKKATCDQDQ